MRFAPNRKLSDWSYQEEKINSETMEAFFALQYDFHIYYRHVLGVLLGGKHAFRVFLFHLLKGGGTVFRWDIEKKGLMHASHSTCHSDRTARGFKHNENEE